jgi:NAD(P)-dependent dehydrogenase (short-subunit alcohol dehydrogenase family)
MTPSNTPAATPGVAWIAGVGASAGLGAALARRYARGGLAVAISARTRARLDALAQEVRDAGGLATAIPGDVCDEADVRRMAADVQALGPLRAAVFNAGASVRGSALELEPSQFEQTWRGTTFAGFLFARAVLRAMLDNGADPASPHGRGSLIFTGATASVRGGAKFAAFAAAKAGLRSLAQSLARDAGPQGVHVAHVVIDGGIDGERLRQFMPQRAVDAGTDGLLSPDAIAETYWQLHVQHRSAWTQEIDLRPFKEPF